MPRIHNDPKEYENYVQQIQDNLKYVTEKYLDSVREKVFGKFCRLKRIWWEQYTPRFNDGDICYFRANTDMPNIELWDSDIVLSGKELIDEKTGKYFYDENDETQKYIFHVSDYVGELLKVIDDNILNKLYEEATVSIYQDKIEVSDVYVDC